MEYKDTTNIRPNMVVLDQIIAIMERAAKHKSLSMMCYQSVTEARCKTTEELHLCGNTACLAGHIAISAEWKEAGGEIGPMAEPRYQGLPPSQALGRWLGVNSACISEMIFDLTHAHAHRVYNKRWTEVTAVDVLKVLRRIKRARSFSPILKQLATQHNVMWAKTLLEKNRMSLTQKALTSITYPGYDSMYPNMDTLNKMIAIMKRAKAADAIDMTYWQHRVATEVAVTEQQLHACGNRACFAGYIAISPEWKAIGGCNSQTGRPHMTGVDADRADPARDLGRWLGVNMELISYLIYKNNVNGRHVVYGKPWAKVNADDVLKVLNRVKRAGSFSPIIKQIIQTGDETYDSFEMNFLNKLKALLKQPKPTPTIV